MSLEKMWDKINEQKDDSLASLLQEKALPKFTSQSPLLKIKKRLLQSGILSLLTCFFYIYIIIANPIWQVQTTIGMVLLFSIWATVQSFKHYKSIDDTISSSNPLLAELKRHHQSITKWMQLQQKVALFLYPVATTGGFMLGGVLGSGKPVEVFLSKPIILLALLICCVVLMILSHYVARWLCKVGFGKHLNALQEMIRELENGQ
jgi:hypothetical protein